MEIRECLLDIDKELLARLFLVNFVQKHLGP